ncbi:MAG: HdeA/HdeB family chaperone [Xanthobacteraceae bacterium]
MKTVAAIVLATALIVAPAGVQAVDLSRLTCKDFLAGGGEAMGFMMTWLDGYYTDEDAPAIFDLEKMKEKGAKLGEYCAKHPTIGLMTAAAQFMGKIANAEREGSRAD